MANVTVTIDDTLLQRARVQAAQRGTSVNALIRRWLEEWVGDDPSARATNHFLALSEDLTCGSGPEGRRWTRDKLNDR